MTDEYGDDGYGDEESDDFVALEGEEEIEEMLGAVDPEAVLRVERAMEEDQNALEELEAAEEQLDNQAQFAAALATGIYDAKQEVAESYEDFAEVVGDYLEQDTGYRLEKASELVESAERVNGRLRPLDDDGISTEIDESIARMNERVENQYF